MDGLAVVGSLVGAIDGSVLVGSLDGLAVDGMLLVGVSDVLAVVGS